jgi:ubiquinone/menaquinone biosynthesis C-methylase UbiE
METLRRKYLNILLNELKLKGKVLDVGGQKFNKRSDPRLDLSNVEEFLYLNNDKTTKPDILAEAQEIPFESDYFDFVLLIEVLEHVKDPISVLKEVNRVIKEGGFLIMSMPFLNSIHADPYDFQRWTPTKIILELKKIGNKNIIIKEMGGFYAVINDLIRFQIYKNTSVLRKIYVWIYNYFLKIIFFKLDKFDSKSKDYMTTGYFIYSQKA